MHKATDLRIDDRRVSESDALRRTSVGSENAERRAQREAEHTSSTSTSDVMENIRNAVRKISTSVPSCGSIVTCMEGGLFAAAEDQCAAGKVACAEEMLRAVVDAFPRLSDEGIGREKFGTENMDIESTAQLGFATLKLAVCAVAQLKVQAVLHFDYGFIILIVRELRFRRYFYHPL
jgi:hypothetical protein